MSGNANTLFVNRRQTWKVRMLQCASLLACAGALFAGWHIFQTYGLAPGDGGTLRPASERFAFGAFVAGLGLLFAGSMALYAALYATRVTRQGDRLIIETLSPFGFGTRRHEFDRDQIEGTSFYHGQMRTPRHSINAPWHTLSVKGRRLPFILDAQAEELEVAAIRTFIRSPKRRD